MNVIFRNSWMGVFIVYRIIIIDLIFVFLFLFWYKYEGVVKEGFWGESMWDVFVCKYLGIIDIFLIDDCCVNFK